MKRFLLARLDQWLRHHGCCILPFTRGKISVEAEDRIYDVDLDRPYGHKITGSRMAPDNEPHVP